MTDFTDQPEPPVYYMAVQTFDCVQYTDVSQQQWFFDRIRFAYGGTNPNVRLDTDGTTILFFGSTRLHLTDWLYKGTTVLTDAALRASRTNLLRPVNDTFPETTPGA